MHHLNIFLGKKLIYHIIKLFKQQWTETIFCANLILNKTFHHF